ncbi:DsbA family protein [Streptomyces odontomachi]|uniref:DsbA family protein n=1 Tax=Streptomyces odontomachi TaxID=2944940 RepID=UPI0021090CBA|nr:thioredoxin domain-containing protein [Streptomyces sp. ODS25]
MNDKHPDNGHDNGSGGKKPNGKRSARERLAVERERLKARDKRRRSLITGGAVLGILGLAAVAGVLAANADGGRSDSEGPIVAPTGATGEGGLAIPVGRPDAKSTLTVWEDFRCPACKQFEGGYRSTVHELVDKGQLKVEYHLVTLIDHNMGGSGSLRAANAAACAQEAGRFTDYHDVLYTNQPEETKDTFAGNATLIRLAGKVPGLTTPAFKKCVESGRHDSWVVKSDRAFTDKKLSGTPTVLLNGTSVYGNPRIQFTPQKLKTMVEEADRK